MFAHHAAVLEWHTIGIGELQIGQTLVRFRGQAARFGETFAIKCRQSHKAVSSLRYNLLRCAVGTEKLSLAKFVERKQRRHASRDACVSGERRMLGSRKFETFLRLPHSGDHCRRAQCEKNRLWIAFFHSIPLTLT